MPVALALVPSTLQSLRTVQYRLCSMKYATRGFPGPFLSFGLLNRVSCVHIK